ncbi:MAG TPA: enoyl-CoA hydratase/isomerase family protein, partial [Candidatus Hydrogenedentes bacterium]|nr:enoyl-CoA hydratase/isomerase family protein [Candidatus Hydrogenedentota bacterium]
MNSPYIKTSIQEKLWVVSLDRPEKRNAITFDMLMHLGEAVAEVDQHPELRAVIVRAEGPVFSAGIDIASLMEMRNTVGEANLARWLRRGADRLQYALHLIESTELPVIGALQGKVIGLGLELALAFDLRVCTPDCQFSIPESRMGLVADVGGTTRLSRTVGPARAKDLLMTARAIGAEEALGWGLVNRIATNGDAFEEASRLADQIAQNAPLAVGMAKRIVDQGDGLDKHSQMAIERWAQSQLIATDDVIEAAMSFMEKRPA